MGLPKINNKGQVTVYLTFVIFAIIIVVLTALVAPFGVKLNTDLYAIGEDMILDANDSLSQIGNTTVRDTLYTTFGEAQGATQTNIEVNSAAFQYAWLLLLGLGALIMFLYTRRIVEVGGGLV